MCLIIQVSIIVNNKVMISKIQHNQVVKVCSIQLLLTRINTQMEVVISQPIWLQAEWLILEFMMKWIKMKYTLELLTLEETNKENKTQIKAKRKMAYSILITWITKRFSMQKEQKLRHSMRSSNKKRLLWGLANKRLKNQLWKPIAI